MKGRWIGVSAAAVLLATQAMADETDPAITVCEIAIKKTLKAPKSYERVSAGVMGSTVVISYDAVNEYNAPLRHSQICEFYREKDKIALVPLEVRSLIEQGVDLRERAKSAKAPDDASAIERGVKASQMAVTAMTLRIAAIGLEAAKVTEYPIPPTKTKVEPLPAFPQIPD